MIRTNLRTIVAASILGLAASAFAQAPKSQPVFNRDGVQVQTNTAELLGTVTADIIHVDVHNDPIGQEWRPGDPVREIPRQHWNDPAVFAAGQRAPVNPVAAGVDKLAQVQRAYDATVNPIGRAFTTPVYSFEGAPGTTLPPDPSGDVGATQFVQAVNASGGTRIRVYNKSDGAQVGNFILTTQLGGTGACASGLGDPIVVYDGIADRWVITEFSSQAGRTLCVYVSATSDALGGTFYRYGFQTAAFPDYPKYGVWPNAYYVGANESSASGQRPLLALERAPMLTGGSARFVRVNVPTLAGFGFQMVTPASVTGPDLPPTGAPGIFMRHVDDEAHFAGSNDPTKDYLQMWQLAVDWTPATPTTTLTGPSQIFISEFSSDLNGLSAFNAFPQPNGQKLDPLREPIMNVLMYRNLGSYEAIVGNMVTDVDAADTGGVRWFELRRTGGLTGSWSLFQEGTYAPSDAGGPADRWMAGIGIDSSGNLGMAYSVARQSPGIFASLRYVGRLNGDPLSVMTTAETELATGERSQSNERWGDYHQMGVDPVNGCTFWFTGEYMGPAGSTNNTRVGAFRHDNCGTPSFTLSPMIASANICVMASPVALPPNTINVGSINSFNSPVSLILSTLPTGFMGSFTPSTVPTLPGTSTLNLTASPGVAPGNNIVTIQGTSGAIVKTSDIEIRVATITPTAPALSMPANGATNVAINPTLSWTASAQAASYMVQVASDAAFTNVVFSGSVSSGTSILVTTGLSSSTTYFWRVTSANTCGTSAQSAVFSFTTVPAPGDCSVGNAARNVFLEDFTNGANGFVTTGGTGTSWALSTARPSPASGGNAMKSAANTGTSNQLLTSPTITLPTGQLPVTLAFNRWRFLEINGTAACYDGGFMEISVSGGAFTAIPSSKLLNDSYTGPAPGGQPAWCSAAAVDYNALGTLIDLSD
ncbi:MAG: fibronectin type III domain-containing protein, partial [Dokdonella sp.]